MKYLAFTMDIVLLKTQAWNRVTDLIWVDFPLKPCKMGTV